MPLYLPAEEESSTEAATGTAPDQSELHITATFKNPYPNSVTLEGWDQYTPTQRRMIASHYHCPKIPIFEDKYLQLGNRLARSENRKFVSHANSIPDEDAVHPPNIPTNIPPLGDDVTNSDEAIAAVLGEDDARDPTVKQAATANQSSASTQPTKSRKFNPNCDSLRNWNVDDDVVMKVCPE